MIIIPNTPLRIEIKLLSALRSCGRDASSVDGILEIGKGIIDVVAKMVFGEEDSELSMGNVAAADGYFWVGGAGDGNAVGCGEAVQLGLTECAGFADPGADAGGGGGDVSGGGIVSVVVGGGLVGGKVLEYCCWCYRECLWCGSLGWDFKEKSNLTANVAVATYCYAQGRNNAIERPTL